MKAFLLLFILAPYFVLSQTVNKNGFGTYTFGTSPADYKDLTLEIDEDNSKLFSAPAQLEGIDFSDVNLTFSKNKLSAISLRTKNSNGSKLFQKLKEIYGEPRASSKLPGSFEWTASAVYILYEKSKSGVDAVVSLYSKALKNQK